MNSISENEVKFDPILNESLNFSSQYKLLKQKGNLVYEYNPFRNYRLQEHRFEYKNKLYSLLELKNIFKISLFIGNKWISKESQITDDYLINANELWIWKQEKCDSSKCELMIIPESLEIPILKKKGELVDFETDELKFDINHPVDLLPQYSYDGSVNLIINDGKNSPKLINSRFSPVGKNKYQIVDRKGDNDTNIYDLGEQFDIDTSLYKNTNNIPLLFYYGTTSCGNLKIGNYHFYFKYVDADGNESDFISESGLVSIFIGELPYNINGGFRDQNSYKGVVFKITNIDKGYLYLSVYYTRSSSDIFQHEVTSAYKIDQKFTITSYDSCNIKVTGFEPIIQISLDSINEQYLIAKSVNTLAQCLNMLFFGNIEKNEINYKELTDISLRFLPFSKTEAYNISDKISNDYEILSDYENSYYNSKFIYDKTGYWPNEIYRFGIVYILKDNTLSPVFNIRGKRDISEINDYLDIPYYNYSKEGEIIGRNYITFEEKSNLIINNNKTNSKNIENCKGVITIKDNSEQYSIFYLNFKIQENCKNEILSELKKLGVKGFFFVRLKRIPITLCLAFTIGIDKKSHTPVIPYKENNEIKYISESFLDQGKIIPEQKGYLVHDYKNRIFELEEIDTDIAAICPDYDINNPLFNTIFNGDQFVIEQDSYQPNLLSRLNYEDRYYYYNLFSKNNQKRSEKVNIQAVEDNTKLSAIDDLFFSARAGEAEEAFRFEYLKSEIKTSDATNLVRGSFGPFIGLKSASIRNNVINIKIPNYDKTQLSDYFLIRYDDKSPYYAISDRISINTLQNYDFDCYRGDCYICQFTHRINRNFLSPSAPTNDLIVDEKCWKDNYKVENGKVNQENFQKINLGDVNAVVLGLWITIVIRSSKNLNIRSLDESNISEISLFGHPRTFYPNCPLSAKGIYKIPEALCYNNGFSNLVSERINIETPDVPTLKNEFTNRIIYSDINVNDAFKNGYRIFKLSNYRDYDKSYGQITKLLELKGNLICVFEHGIAIIPVNERVLSGQGDGGNVFVNSNKVLPINLNIISNTFGSQWKDSIIKTDFYIYGVDTIAKKIWRTDGLKIECISDQKVLEFLNNNISLTEREIEPIIGIRNIKTHYNKFKNDIMFTFYDNLEGFKEKVWNLCFNEKLNKFITFYSWIPSYSENIYNSFFSFDRNTSKWISKLGISKKGNSFSNTGIVISNNIIHLQKQNFGISICPEIGELSIVDKDIPKNSENINVKISYNLNNNPKWIKKMFNIENNILYLTGNYYDLCSELYLRGTKEKDSSGKIIYTNIIDNINESNKLDWINNCVNNDNYSIVKNENGIRLNLINKYNFNKIVTFINIEAIIEITYNKLPNELEESYTNGFNNNNRVNSTSYQTTIAIIPEYNLLFLTTDFWRHGLSGIIDISDKIQPTMWYGKQHPFEFEFVVADNPQLHKIFDNIEIISNNAEPESFHYEIVGDSYNFANDKKNMYIRQEATKELYSNNGCYIDYNPDYINLNEKHRINLNGVYDKSTLLPLYYSRVKSVNEIEDYYHLKDGSSESKNYSSLSGAEIIKYDRLDEYRICNHAKSIDLKNNGRLRGNTEYLEDKWKIQINPVNFVLKNESKWGSEDLFKRTNLNENKIPIEIGQSPIPGDVLLINSELSEENIPLNSKDRAIVTWNWEESQNKEIKLKDKWIKIRIRYSGKKLAVITAIKTLYTISYV